MLQDEEVQGAGAGAEETVLAWMTCSDGSLTIVIILHRKSPAVLRQGFGSMQIITLSVWNWIQFSIFELNQSYPGIDAIVASE